MKKTLTTAILLSCLLTASLVNAQIIIKSNDTAFRYDQIKSAHYLEITSNFDLQGKQGADYVDEKVIHADSVRHTVVFVTSFMYDVGKVYVDSSLYDQKGPVSYHFITSTNTKDDRLIYHANSVESHTISKGKTTDKNTDMAPGYFDDTSVWGLVGYLTLKPGVKYQLNCFGSNNKVPLPLLIEYLFDDPTKLSNGTTAILKVIRAEYDGDVFYLWFDPVTHICMKDVVKYAKGMSVTTVL